MKNLVIIRVEKLKFGKRTHYRVMVHDTYMAECDTKKEAVQYARSFKIKLRGV